MSEFIFLRPMWFYGIIPLIIIAWIIRYTQNNQHSWSQVCDAKLLKHLIVGSNLHKSNTVSWSILLFGLIAIIALAGPAWDKLPQPVFRQQSSLTVVFDLSKSMLAEDVKPSRLVRARLKLLDILKFRNEGQTALIVYSGDAFVVTPLTNDSKTIQQLVPSLKPSMMPSLGSRTDLAISKAISLFTQSGVPKGEILLITDEVPEIYINRVNSILAQTDYNLSILSVGSEQGAPINLEQAGFLKDSQGNIVIAKTNNSFLRTLALQNHGRFSKMSVNDSDIQYLLNKKLFDSRSKQDSHLKQETEIWKEQGPWLVLLLLPFVLFSFRQGIVFVFIVILLPLPKDVYALSWEGLWSNQDQQAKALYDEGLFAESITRFQNSDWQAAVNYKAGNYEKTIEILKDRTSVQAIYNRANAYAKLKQYEDALKDYSEVIEQQANHQDALYNKKIIEEQLKKQQENANKNNESEDGQQKKSDQENSDQKKSEQQDSEQQKNKQQGDQQQAQDQRNQDSQQQQEKQSEQSNDANSQQKDLENKEQAEKKAQENIDTEQQNNNNENNEQKTQRVKSTEPSKQHDKEKQQAVEQWLRKIPDDPSALMRRKFRYQYQTRNNKQNSEGPSW